MKWESPLSCPLLPDYSYRRTHDDFTGVNQQEAGPMKQIMTTTIAYSHLRFLIAALVVLATFIGCRTAPISGRKQVIMIPEQQEIEMGRQAYEEVLAEEKLSTNRHYIEMVNRVGKRIAAVSGKDDYDWEFRVISSPTMNAFALPGGKVAIYEGIMPICENEAGLAVVMSHEIAHALARHGGERMTQQSIVNGLGRVVEYASRNREQKKRDRIRALYGIGTQYGFTLPYSRKQESEADQIGLMLMARAGYDPTEAPRFWRRFSQQNGEKPPEFMSTHPSDEHRAADLQAMLPEAYKEYESAPEQYALGQPIFTSETLNAGALAKQSPAQSQSPASAATTNKIQPASGSEPPSYPDPFRKYPDPFKK